jgi:hypothetical protein
VKFLKLNRSNGVYMNVSSWLRVGEAASEGFWPPFLFSFLCWELFRPFTGCEIVFALGERIADNTPTG